MPDAIGWKRASPSVLIECKISRARLSGRSDKPSAKAGARIWVANGSICTAGLLDPAELPPGWGLLELRKRKVEVVRPRLATSARHPAAYEMNLLLASLRRVEIRIEPPDPHRVSQVEEPIAAVQRRHLAEACRPPTRSETTFWNRQPTPRSNYHWERCPTASPPVQRAGSPVPMPSPKKTGLVRPVSRASVEMRLHHDAARAGNEASRPV